MSNNLEESLLKKEYNISLSMFENAFKELDFVGEYDYFVVNEKVSDAVSNIESIIVAEKLRVKRQSGIKEKIVSQGGK